MYNSVHTDFDRAKFAFEDPISRVAVIEEKMKCCKVNLSCLDNIQANLHVKTWVGVFFVESYIKDMSHRMLMVMDAGSNLLHVSGHIDDSAFASLTVWNMKTWKAMTVLPLGEDPPAITSLCFNHNGKILAASATDGMIHMFGKFDITINSSFLSNITFIVEPSLNTRSPLSVLAHEEVTNVHA
ncbi:hypothetical protein NL676_000315 [Syzygium grande]|nr:hypothetical protein NL676_000315 [Syzygium grande]